MESNNARTEQTEQTIDNKFSVEWCLERWRSGNPDVQFPEKLYTSVRFTDETHVLEWVHVLMETCKGKVYNSCSERVYVLTVLGED